MMAVPMRQYVCFLLVLLSQGQLQFVTSQLLNGDFRRTAVSVGLNSRSCICPQYFEVVCGSDGRLYDNACKASCAGVQVVDCSTRSPIPPATPIPKPGTPGIPQCPGQEVNCFAAPCQVDTSACKGRTDLTCIDNYCGGCNAFYVSKATGQLVKDCKAPKPGCICTLQYDPVCGVDGKTYGNACAAGCANVAVKSKGECGSEQSPSPSPTPGAAGCAAVTCPSNVDPVCGTDGKTYPNDCLAGCSGATVAFKGECKSASPSPANSPKPAPKAYLKPAPQPAPTPSQVTRNIKCRSDDPGARCLINPCSQRSSCKGSPELICYTFYCTKPVWFKGTQLTTPCKAVYVSKKSNRIVRCRA